MSSDNRPEIVLDGDVSPFKQKLREAAADLRRFGEDGTSAFEKMTGPLGVLQSKLIAVGGVLAGGSVFKASIDAIKEQAGEVKSLSAALGITSFEATVLSTALGNVFLSKDSYLDTTRAMVRAISSNGDAFRTLGIQIHSTNGRLLPMQQIIANTVSGLDKFKAGADRNSMAFQLIGRGYEDVLKASKLTAESMEEARDEVAQYHKNLDPEMVKRYSIALENFGDGLEGVRLAIGRESMPVLTELANWFSGAGPVATEATIVSMNALVSAYESLRSVVVEVWSVISAVIGGSVVAIGKALGVDVPSFGTVVVNSFRIIHFAVLAVGLTFETIMEGIRGVLVVGSAWIMRFAETAKAAMTLNWGAVKSSWEEGGAAVERAVSESAARIRAMNARYEVKIDGALTGEIGSGASLSNLDKGNKGGGRGQFSLDKDKSGGAEKAPGMMTYYEAALAAEKQLASEKNALRDYTKQEELAFWQTLLKHAQLISKDRIAIEKKSAELTVAIRKQEAKDKQDMAAETTRFDEAMALGRVDAEMAAAEAAVDAGQITKMQLLEMEMQFERQRLEIQRTALNERLQLAEQDPNASDVEKRRIQNQMLQLEQQSGTKMIQLQRKVGQQSGQIWADLGQRMSGMWDKGITSLMNGTFRWRNAFKAVGLELVNWFASTVVGGMVKENAAGLAKTVAAKISALFAEQTAQKAGSAIVVATKSTETTAVSGNNAVQAATGAAGAMASIPWVGPVLAIAAMGAMFAAVSAMGGKVKSASKGYAIPKGVNPLMQLHEEEVVLPSHLSKGIGQLIENGGGGGGGEVWAPNFNITAMDAKSLDRFVRKNARAFVPGMRELSRIRVKK